MYEVGHPKLLLHDSLEGQGGKGRQEGAQEEGTSVIYGDSCDAWQKPSQYCEVIILQLNKFFKSFDCLGKEVQPGNVNCGGISAITRPPQTWLVLRVSTEYRTQVSLSSSIKSQCLKMGSINRGSQSKHTNRKDSHSLQATFCFIFPVFLSWKETYAPPGAAACPVYRNQPAFCVLNNYTGGHTSVHLPHFP